MTLLRLEKEKILKKIEDVHKYLCELDEMLPESKEEYISDTVKKRACEKTIELAIENVIDICAIIVSGLKLGIPEDEEDILFLLEKKKILSKKVRATVSTMKGFRNILVHKYGELNDELVYDFLTEEVDDFDAFEDEIVKVLV